MVYAIGDVNERSLLTDIAKHQAHVACEVIDGGQARATRDGGGAPRVVFTDRVAAVGLTLQAAKDQRLNARAYDVPSSATAGARFYGRNTPGTSRLVVDEDRGVIVGATFTGTDVADWLHAATIALVGEIPVERLWEAVPRFPPAAKSGSTCSRNARPSSPANTADRHMAWPQAERRSPSRKQSRDRHGSAARWLGLWLTATTSPQQSGQAALPTLTSCDRSDGRQGQSVLRGSRWPTCCPNGRDVMKVLVTASEPVSADRLRAALGGATDDAEIMVVAPALHRSALRSWLSDADEAIRRAALVQRETVEGLHDAGLDARGDSGEFDPVKAVEDVLVTFRAERTLLFTRPVSEGRYDEGIDAEALQQRFGLPAEHAE
jgi:Pyridine nucleotide-disulphide oxidoreductase, dimerisation domain